MNKFRFTIQMLAVAIFTFAFATMAQAQATRTWVSGVGDDANPCSRTAPCKTFAGAISKTAVNGEIDALDSGGFGALTITKSITVDGSPFQAGVLNATVNGIIINITSATDTRRTVLLRGLSINGAGSGLNGIRIVAGNLAGLKVVVENCTIMGQNGSPGRGIEDFRNNGGQLSVQNTTIMNTAAAAVVVDPNGGGGSASTRVDVNISNCRVTGTGQGLNFGSGARAYVFNTVVTGTGGAGILAIQTGGGTGGDVSVDHCVISNNSIGFNAASANMVIRVSNTTAMNNATLFSTGGGGQVLSYGNNQAGGSAIGSPVTPG